MEEQVKLVIDKWSLGMVHDGCAKEITSMVMEFTKWAISHMECSIKGEYERWVVFDDVWIKTTLEQAFDYWFTNIRNK